VTRRFDPANDQLLRSVYLVRDQVPGFSEYPLWDELIATMGEPRSAARACGCIVAFSVAHRALAAPLPAPVACARVDLGRPLALRAVESPSSAETLLGCSFAYALRYTADVRTGLASAVAAPGPLLSGQIAHYVLARVFAVGALAPPAAAERAAAMVDRMLPELAETLLLDHCQADRATVRRAIVESARAVAEVERVDHHGRVSRRTGRRLSGAANVYQRIESHRGAPAASQPSPSHAPPSSSCENSPGCTGLVR
jgi:hypothetical protein